MRKAVATVSNAMDVGNPSNFVRILEIMQNNFAQLKNALSSYSYDDQATEDTISKVYQQYHYTLDPHGAVAYLAAKAFTKGTNDKALILETAHPVKFPSSVERITGKTIPLPPQAQAIAGKQKASKLMKPDYEMVKAFLLNTFALTIAVPFGFNILRTATSLGSVVT